MPKTCPSCSTRSSAVEVLAISSFSLPPGYQVQLGQLAHQDYDRHRPQVRNGIGGKLTPEGTAPAVHDGQELALVVELVRGLVQPGVWAANTFDALCTYR